MALRLIINRLPSPLPSFFIYGGTRSTFLLKLSALLLDRNRFFHFLFSFFLWGPTGQRSRLCFYDFMSTLWQFCIMSLYLQIGSVFLGFKEFRPMKDFQLKWSLEMERETIFYKKMSTQKGRWWPVLPFGGGGSVAHGGAQHYMTAGVDIRLDGRLPTRIGLGFDRQTGLRWSTSSTSNTR